VEEKEQREKDMRDELRRMEDKLREQYEQKQNDWIEQVCVCVSVVLFATLIGLLLLWANFDWVYCC
jgi:hypothetical protein